MKIIEPSVTEIIDFEGVDNFYKAVARAARICYASDKTTDDKELVESLIKRKHFSPFQHAVIYVSEIFTNNQYKELFNYIFNNVYTIKHLDNLFAINGRVLVEGIVNHRKNFYEQKKAFELLEYLLSIFSNYERKDLHLFKSFIVDTSIGCTREMNRHHNNFYICEQSTRYCNYSKDKFGNEVAFNKPYWWNDNPPHNYINLSQEEYEQELWKQAMQQAEDMYIKALNNDMLTDMARGILPLDTHTKAIYTATIEEWNHIIDLRLKGTTGKPHGDIKIIAEKINNIINKKDENR